jgi:MFS superfamily sulfate permease-like transporter
MDQFRERGQATLRRLIYDRDSEEVDWMAVIRTANELHAQEQQWVQKQDQEMQPHNEERTPEERRRNDATGSFFSANMQSIKRSLHRKKKNRRRPITSHIELDDDSSCSTSDSSAHKSWDTGTLRVHPVDEC